MHSHVDEDLPNELIDCLYKIQGVATSGVELEEKDEVFIVFFELIKKMDIHLVPYAAVSQFIYTSEDTYEDENFIQVITDEINRLPNEDDDLIIKSNKIIQHLELATIQKTALFTTQEKKIRNLDKNLIDISSKTKDIQEQNDKMLVNYISILGIFAAILMGAFGSIQAFIGLFSNAHQLSLGRLLIVSSLGGSSVVLILFLLFNGISKLTKKPISSCDENSNILVKKHPTLYFSFGTFVFIALTGVAIDLRTLENFLTLNLFYLSIPVIWVLLIWIYYSKNKPST